MRRDLLAKRRSLLVECWEMEFDCRRLRVAKTLKQCMQLERQWRKRVSVWAEWQSPPWEVGAYQKGIWLRRNEVFFLLTGKGEVRDAEMSAEEGCVESWCSGVPGAPGRTPRAFLDKMLGKPPRPAFQLDRVYVLPRVLKVLIWSIELKQKNINAVFLIDLFRYYEFEKLFCFVLFFDSASGFSEVLKAPHVKLTPIWRCDPKYFSWNLLA